MAGRTVAAWVDGVVGRVLEDEARRAGVTLSRRAAEILTAHAGVVEVRPARFRRLAGGGWTGTRA